MEKYTIVQHEQRLHWLKDCPVLLQSYALTKSNTNNSIFLQCKFENIADKSIKAMNIAVRCSDISYQKLENVDSFSYLDINIQPYSLFGDTMPVYLPNNMTRNVHIIPLKVIFSDDITWESTSEQIYELAEYEQQPNLNEGRNHLASSLWFRSFALPHLFLLSYAQISTFYIQQYTSPIHIHKANLRV